MVEFREAMVDAVLGAGQVKRVSTKALMSVDQLLQLCDRPTGMRRRELKAICREYRMDRVRDVRNEPARKSAAVRRVARSCNSAKANLLTRSMATNR
jgi:hypothetical protein